MATFMALTGTTIKAQAEFQTALVRLERYATLMDARFQIPGTRIRFGLDPIIGLLPGIGDAIGLLLSLVIVVEAVRLGASKRLLLIMLGNLGLEALLGTVPLLGDLFDAGFKANLRNTRLLRSHLDDRLQPELAPSPRWKQWLLLTVFSGLTLGLLWVAYRLLAPVILNGVGQDH